MSGTLQASIVKDGASATNNLTLDTSGGVTVGQNLAVTGTSSHTGNATFAGTVGVTGAITGSSTIAAATGTLYPIVSGTAVASTSGASITFTGIPSWVKRVTVMFSGVSLSGGSGLRMQLGSGSTQTTGYNSVYYVVTTANGATGTPSTTGFDVSSFSAADLLYGQIIFCGLGSNVWTGAGAWANPTATRSLGVSGAVNLTGVLDRVVISTLTGTFATGTINILYE